jgi:hypothetical protein
MDIRYDVENNVVKVEDIDLFPQSLDINFIGVCSRCNSDVFSMSYHPYENGMLVIAKCNSCDNIYGIIYDKDWNWQSEETISQFFDLKSSNDLKFLDSIDKKKLAAVFTPAEINSMYTKARGEKYTRQYLYRARKKYVDFEDLFGIKINI